MQMDKNLGRTNAGQSPDNSRMEAGQAPDGKRGTQIREILRRSLRDGVFSKEIGLVSMKPTFDGSLMRNPARFSGLRFPG